MNWNTVKLIWRWQWIPWGEFSNTNDIMDVLGSKLFWRYLFLSPALPLIILHTCFLMLSNPAMKEYMGASEE